MLGLAFLHAVLIAWGFAFGKVLAVALSHRATLNLWIASRKTAAKRNVFRRFIVEAQAAITVVLSYAIWLLLFALLPEVVLRDALHVSRQVLAKWTWLYAILAGAIMALAMAVPRYRRWGAWYRRWNTATCPRCNRVNDRPRFPGHHEYYFVFGYPAKINGDRFSCRWCDAPVEFPELDPRIQELPPGGWKIPQ